MGLQRWGPDTCSRGKCLLDEDVNEITGVHVGIEIVQSCGAHAQFTQDTPQQRLDRCLAENIRKNGFQRRVLLAFAANTETIETAPPVTEGKVERDDGTIDDDQVAALASPKTRLQLKRTHGFYWAFDRQRRLRVRLRGFTNAEKTQAQGLADTAFGPGTVVVE